MNTLYVSDLDGTLLRSDETISEYTTAVINSLVKKGMLFSYATARSFATAKKVTEGLKANVPLIVYNGTFIIDHITEEILLAHYFDSKIHEVLDDMFRHDVYPFIYTYADGKEKFSFVPHLCSKGMKLFLQRRLGDSRINQVLSSDELKAENLFHITCIDAPEKLQPLYEKYKDQYHCVYYTELYTKEKWLEIMPREASKSSAIKYLQTMLGCEKLTVFGDGKNDIDMFLCADESYAVKNAHETLKPYATDIILSNDEDGVAKWLLAHHG